MLPNVALLLQRHALLQKGESRLLHRQTYQGRRVLLQEGFVSDAKNRPVTSSREFDRTFKGRDAVTNSELFLRKDTLHV